MTSEDEKEEVQPIGNRLSELRDELDSLKELLDEETKMRLDAEEMVEQLQMELQKTEEELKETIEAEEKTYKKAVEFKEKVQEMDALRKELEEANEKLKTNETRIEMLLKQIQETEKRDMKKMLEKEQHIEEFKADIKKVHEEDLLELKEKYLSELERIETEREETFELMKQTLTDEIETTTAKLTEEIEFYRDRANRMKLEHEFEMEQLKEMHAIESYEAAEKNYTREREVVFLVEKTSERYEETLDHVRELRRLIDKATVHYPGVEAIFENEFHTFRPDTSGKLETATIALKLSAKPPVKPAVAAGKNGLSPEAAAGAEKATTITSPKNVVPPSIAAPTTTTSATTTTTTTTTATTTASTSSAGEEPSSVSFFDFPSFSLSKFFF
jgi:chromosome segregation ATPase